MSSAKLGEDQGACFERPLISPGSQPHVPAVTTVQSSHKMADQSTTLVVVVVEAVCAIAATGAISRASVVNNILICLFKAFTSFRRTIPRCITALRMI
jgi:hypothetical protein